MTMSFSRRHLVWARSGPVRRDPTRSRSLAMRHAPRLRPSRPPPYTKRSFEPRPPRSSPLTLDKVTRGLQLLVTTERLNALASDRPDEDAFELWMEMGRGGGHRHTDRRPWRLACPFGHSEPRCPASAGSGPGVSAAHHSGLGAAGSCRFHPHPSASSGRGADPWGGNGPARWVRVWALAGLRVFDPGANRWVPLRVLGWPPAGSPVRSARRQPSDLGSDGVHHRSRGSGPLPRDLPDPRTSQGHPVLRVRAQPHALLGLRPRVHARADAGHLGPLGPGRASRLRSLSRAPAVQCHRRRGRHPFLLLPFPDSGLARQPPRTTRCLTSAFKSSW